MTCGSYREAASATPNHPAGVMRPSPWWVHDRCGGSGATGWSWMEGSVWRSHSRGHQRRCLHLWPEITPDPPRVNLSPMMVVSPYAEMEARRPPCRKSRSPRVGMSFPLSFHQAALDPTGVHWLDDPPDLSCKGSTRHHAKDGWRRCCNRLPCQVGGSLCGSPPAITRWTGWCWLDAAPDLSCADSTQDYCVDVGTSLRIWRLGVRILAGDASRPSRRRGPGRGAAPAS
jgi:hypothetical protein